MQIGKGKQGVRIGEYEPSKDTNAVIGYIEPAGDRPQWILWFTNNGDAILHRERSDTGAIEDEPMRIKAHSQGNIIRTKPLLIEECVQRCTREKGHGGPCNGWSCAT